MQSKCDARLTCGPRARLQLPSHTSHDLLLLHHPHSHNTLNMSDTEIDVVGQDNMDVDVDMGAPEDGESSLLLFTPLRRVLISHTPLLADPSVKRKGRGFRPSARDDEGVRGGQFESVNAKEGAEDRAARCEYAGQERRERRRLVRWVERGDSDVAIKAASIIVGAVVRYCGASRHCLLDKSGRWCADQRRPGFLACAATQVSALQHRSAVRSRTLVLVLLAW